LRLKVESLYIVTEEVTFMTTSAMIDNLKQLLIEIFQFRAINFDSADLDAIVAYLVEHGVEPHFLPEGVTSYIVTEHSICTDKSDEKCPQQYMYVDDCEGCKYRKTAFYVRPHIYSWNAHDDYVYGTSIFKTREEAAAKAAQLNADLADKS